MLQKNKISENAWNKFLSVEKPNLEILRVANQNISKLGFLNLNQNFENIYEIEINGCNKVDNEVLFELMKNQKL